ncbi:uncharacterized [Tachysurus ichikawai]
MNLLLDYTSEPFIARREPVQKLISSFSSLYVESEGGVAVPEEDNDSSCLPPRPPEEDEESLISLTIVTKATQLEDRLNKIEEDGALVERDMAEERAFWKQHQAEQSYRRGGLFVSTTEVSLESRYEYRQFILFNPGVIVEEMEG